jgi:hypothetical protein
MMKRLVKFVHFSMVVILFWYKIKCGNWLLVETNTLVKSDFEKVENSQSYEEKFGQVSMVSHLSRPNRKHFRYIVESGN